MAIAMNTPEQAVIGAILLHPEAMDEVADILRPEFFGEPKNASLFGAIADLYGHNEPIDGVAVMTRLKDTGARNLSALSEYTADLLAGAATAAHISGHAQIVRRDHALRRIAAEAEDLQHRAVEDGADPGRLIERATSRLVDLADEASTECCVKDLAQGVYDVADAIAKGRTPDLGIQTGYAPIDGVLAGMTPGDMVILAARPSMGKTSLALNIGTKVSLSRKIPVGVFSLEMSGHQLGVRLVSSVSEIPAWELRADRLNPQKWERLTAACNKLYKAPMYVDDAGGLSLIDVRARTKRWIRSRGIGLVIIDYLQLMTAGGRQESRQQEVSAISRGLKAMAKDLKIPVLVLSQLSRACEQRENKRPVLSDLRESGAIEQDADAVMFIYREEVYKPNDDAVAGVAEINIAKQRNGPTGTVRLHFDRKLTQFKEVGR